MKLTWLVFTSCVIFGNGQRKGATVISLRRFAGYLGRIGCATLACSPVFAPAARAQERQPTPAQDISAAALTRPERALGTDRVRITVGPGTVQPGEARYAVRSVVAGSGLMVSFSASQSSRGAPIANGFVAGGFAGAIPRHMPISSARLTSSFGLRRHPISGGLRQHAGIDLAAPAGTPVFSTVSGVVGKAGWAGGYGLLITVVDANGVQTRYGHLSGLAVAQGQFVSAGDVVGYVGSTGNSTGPHLHYEVRVNGIAVNPLHTR